MLRNVIFHLPRLAGELLVKQYNRDVQAILKEHPSLLKLKGRETVAVLLKSKGK